MKKFLVLLVVLCCLSLSCASGPQAYGEARTWGTYDTSWWGMDPVCSPGCPPGQSGQSW